MFDDGFTPSGAVGSGVATNPQHFKQQFPKLPMSISDSPSKRPAGSHRSVMLLMANALDCDALSLWCKYRLECDRVECAIDLEKGLERCRIFRPRLLAIDPIVARDAIDRATAILREGAIDHLLILDSRPFELRLADILHEPAASYVSREAPPLALASAIAEILQNDTRAFDPALAPRIRRTSKGYQLVALNEESLLTLLSPRERQVMRLLAEGNTVSDCAAALGLSHSTIDNHKSRLMKKLRIHKAAELTVRAIQEGMIHLEQRD